MSKTSDYLKKQVNNQKHLTTNILIYTTIGIIIGEIYYYLYSSGEALVYPVYALIFLLFLRIIEDYSDKKQKKKK